MFVTNKKCMVIAVLYAVLAFVIASPAMAAPEETETIKGVDVAAGRILVKFRAGVSKAVAKQLIGGKGYVDRIEGLFEKGANGKGALPKGGVQPHKKRGAALRQWYVIYLRAGVSVESALKELRAVGEIETAEPDMLNLPNIVPNDPLLGNQWALNNVGQTSGLNDADVDGIQAWDIETGKSSVVVAVVDSGIDYTHDDLLPNMWVNQAEVNGQPYVDDDNNGCVDDIYGCDLLFRRHTDLNYHGLGGALYNAQANVGADPEFHRDSTGHGTHIAGIIGAAGNNGIGVSGVNWSVKLMAVKTYGKAGGGFTSANVRGIIYAVDNGARIINASWGHPDFDGTQGSVHALLKDAIAYAQANDVLFVTAAGNDNLDIDQVPVYPASIDLDNIITVGGTGKDDRKYAATNYGVRSVDISAPAVDILSTAVKPGAGISGVVDATGYAEATGTSMAAPFVSGTAALMLAQNPSLTYNDLKQRILASADSLGRLTEYSSSASRLNIKRAVELAKVSTTLHARPVNYSGGPSVSVPLDLINNDSAAGIQFDLLYPGDVLDIAGIALNQSIAATHTLTWSEVPAYDAGPTIFDMNKKAVRVLVSPINQSHMSIASGGFASVDLSLLGTAAIKRERIEFKNVVVPDVQSGLIGAVAYDGTISNVSTAVVTNGSTLAGTAEENLRLVGDGSYVVTGDFVVPRGLSLTVEPGAKISFGSGASLIVNGSIDIGGTEANPVQLAGVGTNPGKGSWQGVVINDVNSQSTISNVVIKDAEKGIAVNVGNPSISNVTLSNNHYGIYIYGHSAPQVSGSSITDNDYGIYVEGDENDDYMNPRPLIKRNSIYSNALYNYYAAAYYKGWSVHLSAIENWWGTTDATAIASLVYDNSDEPLASPHVQVLPFLDANGQLTTGNTLSGQLGADLTIGPNETVVVTGRVTVPAGVKLVVSEGATLRFTNRSYMYVYGRLNVNGTEANPVSFTSDATNPVVGDWLGVTFISADVQSSLENLSIEYANNAINANATSVAISRVNISNSRNGVALQNGSDAIVADCDISVESVGIFVFGSSPHIFGNYISDAYAGLFVMGASNPAIDGANVITNNQYGIYLRGNGIVGNDPQPTITNNSIYNNIAYNVKALGYYDASLGINAQGNWWGTVSEDEVASKIMDAADTTIAGYPYVTYSGFLSSGPGLPTLVANLNSRVVSGTTETLDASESRSINGIVSYSWQQISGPAVTIQRPDSAIASYTAPNVGLVDGRIEFKLLVRDSIGRVSSEIFPVTVTQPIPLSGVLSSDYTMETGKIYHITDTLYVPPGVTLTINAGVDIKVAETAFIRIRGGVLDMRGTAEQPVLFDYLENSGTSGYWFGIVFEPWTSGSELPASMAHAVISRAVNAITVYALEVNLQHLTILDSQSIGIGYYANSRGTIADTVVMSNADYPTGLYIRDSSPTLESNMVVDNRYGIYLSGASNPLIHKGNIVSNNEYGFLIRDFAGKVPNPVINNNSIYDNTRLNIRASVRSSDIALYIIDATSNFWNLPDVASVKNTIEDYEDYGGALTITTISVEPILQWGGVAPKVLN